MIDISKYTDPYERKARVFPALLCLLPVVIAISVNFPELYTSLTGFIGLVVAFGGLQLLAQMARDGGKKLEPNLFNEWGGIPSVNIFRYRDNIIPAPTKKIIHQSLSDKTKVAAPTFEYENNHPEDADEVYRAWSDHLRGHSRDTNKFSLLFKENINYGFRRNILGMKNLYGVFGILALGVFLIPSLPTSDLNNTDFTVMFIIALYTLWFMFFVNFDWVKVPADEYAKRLVEVVEHI
ncbi:hypothetical protein A9Q98_14905 [Thalassotalea sp. 42_200_T64]|nr:hypothetical protein A9Q98_14905 [Thalassotalea sp. 42_200_T64]